VACFGWAAPLRRPLRTVLAASIGSQIAEPTFSDTFRSGFGGEPLKRLTKVLVAALSIFTIGALLTPTAVEAATKYFSTTKTVTGRSSVNCPAGFKVTGGGYTIPQDLITDTLVEEYGVTSSAPTATGWRVVAHKTRTTLTDANEVVSSVAPYSATVYAICVG
jgi:hypothetical protein